MYPSNLIVMSPLPIVSLILVLFVVCAGVLAALIVHDSLAERRKHAEPAQPPLNFEALIRELTAKSA